jgi:hypothetical protein
MPDLDRSGYELVLDEQFSAQTLNDKVWLPYHLPHWSSRDRSAARYRLTPSGLELLIEEDQEAWYPDGDGWTRLSTLQTGEFAGALGGTVGQHRFKPTLTVREVQPSIAFFTPTYGLVECRARAIGDPANMVALWMIGYEEVPEHSAEICVFEIMGGHISDKETRVGMGVHPHHDPSMDDDFARERVALDARDWHTYAANWTPYGVDFFVDEQLVKSTDQSPDYPMQLMLSAFEFCDGPEPASGPEGYPKVFGVDWLRYWQLPD